MAYRHYESSTRNLNYDRYVDRDDQSALSRMQQHYWTAKQTIRSKLGKKEDDHLVASDAELDSKLASFYSIKNTCESMLRCIERYQDFICDLSHDENALGRFLKQRGKKDKTQAGKMMTAVGRAQSFTAQQRLALRVPLVRLYQELDVFTERAVGDCLETVEAAERARTEYRGSLLWMKNVSEQLDPDTYRQLEKYRAVQAAVRRNKAKFDKLKLDCLQKVDLLAASRCNLFSNIMTNYQNCLLSFWDRTSKAHQAVSENFQGYQHYEFVILKDLAEPSKRLAELTAGSKRSSVTEEGEEAQEELIELDNGVENRKAGDVNLARDASLEKMLFGPDSPEHKMDEGEGVAERAQRQPNDYNLLRMNRSRSESPLGIEEESTDKKGQDVLNSVIGPLEQKQISSEAVPRLPPPPGWSSTCTDNSQQQNDIADTSFVDQMASLNLSNDPISELFDDSQISENDTNSFAYQWHQAFGTNKIDQSNDGKADQTVIAKVERRTSTEQSEGASPLHSFLPSELLDLALPTLNLQSKLTTEIGQQSSSNYNKQTAPVMQSQQKKRDWFDLFADIDPLKGGEMPPETSSDRQC